MLRNEPLLVLLINEGGEWGDPPNDWRTLVMLRLVDLQNAWNNKTRRVKRVPALPRAFGPGHVPVFRVAGVYDKFQPCPMQGRMPINPVVCKG